MIVSRAPFRFSLGGGGTDLPAYYEQYGGFVVSAAIDSYIYVTANKRFYPSIRLAYSETETPRPVSSWKVERTIARIAAAITQILRSRVMGKVPRLG